jgi:hypothetical protein
MKRKTVNGLLLPFPTPSALKSVVENGNGLCISSFAPSLKPETFCSPNKPNPAYKGKWSAPQVANPAYKGLWAPRKIPNPDYFEDLTPVKSLNKIVGTCLFYFIFMTNAGDRVVLVLNFGQ